MPSRKRSQSAPRPSRADIVRLLRENVGAQRMYTVWVDWVEMLALAISNACDLAQREERERRYLDIARRYTSEQMERFALATGALVNVFETEGFADVLGEAYSLLELPNEERGQFFTPYHVCRLMAQMTLDGAAEAIAAQGYVTVSDPASGAGAMLIAAAETLQAAGINYQQQMHVAARDIDATAVHMAYIQLALLYVPAVVVQGDTLRMTEVDTWYTPAHIYDGWKWKLRNRRATPTTGEHHAMAATV